MFFQMEPGFKPGSHADAKPLFLKNLIGSDPLRLQPGLSLGDEHVGNRTVRLGRDAVLKISLAQKEIFERGWAEPLRGDGGVRFKGYKKGNPTLFEQG